MLESTISKNVFLGNGAATAFAFNFRVWDTTELSVVVTSPAGTTTTATGWTAELTESGGTVTYLHNGAPLPEGWKLAIMRDMPFVQEVDLITGTRFDPEVIETALDVATAERQQLLERLERAVVVEPTDEGGPEALLADIRDARTASAASAASAGASAAAAADSAQSAAASAAVATEQREAACICAGEAKDARDVAIAQAEAANTLMEAELAKVNAIVAANKTDQQAAVTAARQWAEKDPDTPVDYDEDGNPRYSARHWAENAQKTAMEPATAERRGAVRVGAGLHLATGENGDTDVLAVDAATLEQPGISRPDGLTITLGEDGQLAALGGNLLANDEIWLTASGVFIAPLTGWYQLWIIGGGYGGAATVGNNVWACGGKSGGYLFALKYLHEGDAIPVTIGAGGLGTTVSTNPNSGGATSFGDLSSNSGPSFGSMYNVMYGKNIAYQSGSGLGGASPGSNGAWYGAGGGAVAAPTDHRAGNGMQGAVRLRFWNPARAAGPLVAATFAARGRAVMAAAPETVNFWNPARAAGPLVAATFAARGRAVMAAAPETVNLYDPETGQGSVWKAEDAEAKLAEGMISEEAWLAICAERAAEERAAWLASPDTVEERFQMLRAARKVKLAEYDVAVAELRRKERAGADVTAQLAAWDVYAVALCDLPEQDGAPWDGGGELTPWPEMPAVGNTQET